MKTLTARQIIKILREKGFVLSHQKGSHQIWKNPQTGIVVPIPLHGKSKSFSIGTFLSIVRQSGLPKNLFKR